MSTLELLSILITTAALFGWVSSRWLKLPTTIGTMLLTVVCSLGLLSISRYAPDLHTQAIALVGKINFENLILHGMLPLLLFAGAFLLDLEYLGREKLTVGVLSIVGTVLSTGTTAVLMYWFLPWIGLHPSWLHCLFFGSLISPTDPIAVLEMLRRVGVPKNVQAQLAGESLFNDGVGAVLFLVILDIARGMSYSPVQIGGLLLLKAGGGLLLGLIAALVASTLMCMVDAYQVEVLLTIALAVGGYSLADRLHLSAPLEAVAAGICLRRFNLSHRHALIAHERIDGFWKMIDEVQNAVLFVLLGVEILAIPFSRLLVESGILGIVAVTAVRFAVVIAILQFIRLVQPHHQSSALTLGWGGLRGGLSLALALSIPEGQGRSWILATTYIVVLFSIVVQGGSIEAFLLKLNSRSTLIDN